MDFSEIRYEVADHVATLTLNRPDKLNALTQVMEDEVFNAMKAAHEDDSVRVIILTGAGNGFCSGADISLLQSVQAENLGQTPPQDIIRKYVPDRAIRPTRRDYERAWSYFPAVDKPIIAAINGPAVGLGFVITLFCDIRFAANTARFSTTFAKRGLIAEHGISWMLPRLVGISNALDLLYSARFIDAKEALEKNLISRTFDPEHLLSETIAYAQHLANNVSPRSLRFMKREVYNGLLQSLTDAIDVANGDMVSSFSSDDFKEGVAHYVEKRPPHFTGQ